ADIGQGNCTNVYVDQNFTGGTALGTITIRPGGRLLVSDRTRAIEVATIIVQGATNNPGLLQVGTADCPIGTIDPANQVTLTFTGARSDTPPPNQNDDCGPLIKGIKVQSGGQLRLYGAKGVPGGGVSWTRLREPAGPASYQNSVNAAVPVKTDDHTLRLNKDVTQGPNPWRKGDWIVVGTTSFSPFESEFVQIDTPRSGQGIPGSEVPLLQSLRHYHFGSQDPGIPSDANYNVGPEKNYGVDERGEVG